MQMSSYDNGFVTRMPWEDRFSLLLKSRPHHYAASEPLMAEGMSARRVLFIREGLVQVSTSSSSGASAFLRVLGPGHVLGEEALLPYRGSEQIRTISAKALTGCSVSSMSKYETRDFLNARPHLWELLVQDLLRRTADDQARIASLSCDSADQRLALLLWDLQRNGGIVQEDGGRRIPLPLSQTELAMWIGTSRETVERALAKLRTRGIIATSPRNIVILNAPALAARAKVSDSAGAERAAG